MRQVDIVLPCYNPLPNWAENIIQNIKDLNQVLPETEIFLYLVNDGSTQGVQDTHLNLLRKSLKNFIYLEYAINKGKGYALRKAVTLTKHDYCLYTDVDFPYERESFVKIYEALILAGNDIVAGTRDENYYRQMTGFREPLSKILIFLNKKVFNLPINDTQCGIKGFNQKGREIFLQTKINRYLFDLEFVFLASKSDSINFAAVPVKLRPGITFRKVNPKILLAELISFVKLFFFKWMKN